MGRKLRSRAWGAVAFLIAVAGIAAGVWWFAFTAALDQLDERGRADLALASDQLAGQLRRYRELAVFLSDHPTLTAQVLDGGAGARADALLLEMADKTGSLSILLADAAGRVVATALEGPASVAREPAFRRAMDGALGTHHRAVPGSRQRIFTFAAPVFEPGGPPRGAVMVRSPAQRHRRRSATRRPRAERQRDRPWSPASGRPGATS